MSERRHILHAAPGEGTVRIATKTSLVEIKDDYVAEGHVHHLGARYRRGREAYHDRVGFDPDGSVYKLITLRFELSDEHMGYNSKGWYFRYDMGIDCSYSELTIHIGDKGAVYCEFIPVYAVLPEGASKVSLVVKAWVKRGYEEYLLEKPEAVHIRAGLHTTDAATRVTYPIDVTLVFKNFIKAMRCPDTQYQSTTQNVISARRTE